ncbi:hypothetical protein BDZ89DRAFT_1044687 [Hymenopellis radicata]|nr:hypothetical protein BDZ89DRAFT_1044687 [Hymenopellis radicata]
MEAFFDNKNNVLNAQIRSSVDESVLYKLKTTFSFRGRRLTILQDANPSPGGPVTVGAIHWDDRIVEILGQKKKLSDIKRHEGKYFRRVRLWKWGPERKEYTVKYEDDDWKAKLSADEVDGVFSVPYRPHLFRKPKPTTLSLTTAALEKDEVFLILIFIYSEAKRQDQTNSSVGAGSEGW